MNRVNEFSNIIFYSLSTQREAGRRMAMAALNSFYKKPVLPVRILFNIMGEKSFKKKGKEFIFSHRHHTFNQLK
jgi:hypothetical protein